MHLTQDQIDRFNEDGYINLGRVFTDDEIEEIEGEYDRLVTFEAMSLGNEKDGKFPYRAMLNFRSPKLRRYINHPEITPIMMDLLGPDVRFWWDQGINKAPGSGSVIPWHQDNGYSKGALPPYITAWLALDDSDPENGGILAIPGSHKEGPRHHEMMGVHAYVPDVDESKAVPLNVKAGEHLLFSSLILHQTGGNHTTDRQRRSWVMQFCRGDAKNAVTGEVYDNRAWVARGGEIVAEPYSEREFTMRDHHGSNRSPQKT